MEKKIFILIIFLATLLYFPSIFNFYSHDDFFHLTISKADSFGKFFNFFNILSSPSGFGFYRPLTTQVFYFLSHSIFNLNPMPLHLISFLVFFTVVFMVFKLAYELLEDKKAALLATFFYAVSATHFGHLYYLGAFQELGLAFFFFLSVWGFVKFLKQPARRYYFLSLAAFIGALLSKEFAVMLPVVLLLASVFLKLQRRLDIPFRKLIILLIPFASLLVIYLYLHIFHYGLAQGDSYLWEFSSRVFNTLFWYVVWSLGLPEMLVDFIGPGLKPVPNLFINYGREMTPIFALFFIILLQLLFAALKHLRRTNLKQTAFYAIFPIWFIATLLPVLFLPWHKFTYELTVPLFGAVSFMSLLVTKMGGWQKSVFIAAYLSLSILTVSLTSRTHWITQGGQAAENVKKYLDQNSLFADNEQILFYDTPQDANLPWKPSSQLKTALSNDNFFKVFYQRRIKVLYGESADVNVENNLLELEARQFLNYDP